MHLSVSQAELAGLSAGVVSGLLMGDMFTGALVGGCTWVAFRVLRNNTL